MTSLRPFRCDDLFRFNNVNVDVLTETFNLGFYLSYLAKHPEYYSVRACARARARAPAAALVYVRARTRASGC